MTARHLQDLLRNVQGAADGTNSAMFGAWRAARAQARAAYEQWRARPGATSYAAYRAAEDRADAALEALRLSRQANQTR